MKKSFIALAVTLILAGCNKDDDVSFPLRNISSGDAVFAPSADGGLLLSIPPNVSWSRYQVCRSSTDCTSPIAEGNRQGNENSIDFSVGSGGDSSARAVRQSDGFSIDDLLSLDEQTEVRLFSGDVEKASFSLNPEHLNIVNQYIQGAIDYFKSDPSAAGDFFSTSVAISDSGSQGRVIAIGSPASAANTTNDMGTVNAGSVFIFTEQTPTTQNPARWAQTAVIKFSTPEAGDRFGSTVSLSDDGLTLAVAMPGDDTGASSTTTSNDSGAALIFTKDTVGDGWTQQALLKPHQVTENIQFSGGSLALSPDGNTLAVTSGNGNTVAANGITLFTRSNDQWTRLGSESLQPTGIEADGSDDLGRGQGTLAFSQNGEILAVGAPGNDAVFLDDPSANPGSLDYGIVYTYSRSVSDQGIVSYSGEQFIKSANRGTNESGTPVNLLLAIANQRFGLSLDVSNDGNVLAVGTGKTKEIQSGIAFKPSDTVYIFDRQANGSWLARYDRDNRFRPATIVETGAGTGFGTFVKLSGNGQRISVYSPDAERKTGITTGSDTSTAPVSDIGSVSFYRLDQTNAQLEFNLQPTRPMTPNYRRFGQVITISTDGSYVVAGTKDENSSAVGINNPNDDSIAKDSGAVWVLRLQ